MVKLTYVKCARVVIVLHSAKMQVHLRIRAKRYSQAVC